MDPVNRRFEYGPGLPLPFWSWNDRLDPAELVRQIRMMPGQSIGGFFMHARGGLRIGYLSGEWMECVRACLQAAKELGLRAWVYDEDGWPSGFASGRVPAIGESHQQKYLRLSEAAGAEAARFAHRLGVYRQPDGRLVPEDELEPDRLYYVGHFELNPWYVDTLDGEVAEAFLRLTHERYREALSPQEWQGLEGFFTDEPQVSRNGIPWSLVLPAEYRREYGEDLLPLLPHLFLPIGACRRTRYRFWRLVTLLFSDHFLKKIHDWCDRHGARLTGHLVKEETLLGQLTSNGAVMPHYAHFHLPGIDWLGRGLAPLTTLVQAASVAAQLGEGELLSESFALCGWGARFEDLKGILQWQMVHGVTLLCPHLQAYSLRGLRKRDYPPSLSHHQPWWPEWHVFTGYVARTCALLRASTPDVEVAVLHPQSSAWIHYGRDGGSRIEELDSAFAGLSDALDAARLGFHYVDEILLERHGRAAGGRLHLGRQAYACLIVPPIDNLAASTVRILGEFAGRGGFLLMPERGAIRIGGEEDPSADELRRRAEVYRDPTALVSAVTARIHPVALAPAAAPRARDGAAGPGGLERIRAARRVIAGGCGARAVLYYCINRDNHRSCAALLSVEAGPAARYLAGPDTLEPWAPERRPENVPLRFRFPPGGDLALLVFPGGLPGCMALRPWARRRRGAADRAVDQLETAPVLDLEGGFRLRSASPNLLALDRCDFTVDGLETATDEPVAVVQDRLLALQRPAGLTLVFRFEVGREARIPADLRLVVEDAGRFAIRVNGRRAPPPDGCLFDAAFETVPIAPLVRPGANRVTLRTVFRQPPDVYRAVERAAQFEAEKNKLTFDSEIEAVYLAGDFGVETPGVFTTLERGAVSYRGRFRLGSTPDELDIGGLQAAGFPFFAGALVAWREFFFAREAGEEYYLECDEIGANSIGVELNGIDAGSLYWKPYRLPITRQLIDGPNRLAIRLTTSLRNLLGPHHRAEGESFFVGPFSFFKEDGVFARDWNGGLGRWTDDYCFQVFGVRGLRICREEKTDER